MKVLVGTSKGAFVLEGDDNRETWSVRGPYCDGWPINHLASDPDTGDLWAGGGGGWSGAGVWHSTDGGHTWNVTKLTSGEMDQWAQSDPEFAAEIGWDDTPVPFGTEFSQVWSLARVGSTLFAGTKPAMLLQSDDDGRSFREVKGLSDHPSRADWGPGAAGLTLHTIVADPRDPDRLWVGISAAGVFMSADGGVTWERRNDLADDAALGEAADHPGGPRDGAVGLCVHHVELAGGDSQRLYQQNHVGTWRSDDGGSTWQNITTGLPSTFGFALQAHPRDPDTLWTLPLNGDSIGRFPPDAAAAVWRSRDGGATWQDLRDGLPQTACYFTVLRQAMSGDRLDPAGIYVGTNSGSIFASRDEGETWDEIARHLPTVLSVEVVHGA